MSSACTCVYKCVYWSHHTECGVLALQGLNLSLLHWKHKSLITGLPGKSLYILDINPSLPVSFTDIFSHSLGCLFVLFMVSFPLQKLLSLIRSHSLGFKVY